jgi:HEPN domain-containing protein
MNADIVHEWLAIAAEDLVAAGNCVHGQPPSPKQAAFFVQQAAEMLVKAVLVAWDVRPRSHDIAELVDLIPKAHPGRPGLVGLHRFTRYAVVFRYPLEEPATEPIPEPAEIDSWIAEIGGLKGDFECWLANREAKP